MSPIIEGPEPDYVDGEIVARHLGSIAHADTQDRMMEILRPLRRRFSLCAFPEISLKLSETISALPTLPRLPEEGRAGWTIRQKFRCW